MDARLEAGQVRVAVHNSGSVIPPEDLPFVFDRFYRVDKSRARDVDGSGLGLAIAVLAARGCAVAGHDHAADRELAMQILPSQTAMSWISGPVDE